MKASVNGFVVLSKYFTIKLHKFFKKCLQESKKHSIFALALRHEAYTMVPQLSWQSKGLKILVSPVRFLVAPQRRKAKQRKILIFNENRDFLFFPLNDNDCASECNIKIECYATSAANLRGAKQRKKVRFTTAFGGVRGGAKGCSKYLHLERVFF